MSDDFFGDDEQCEGLVVEHVVECEREEVQ